MLLVTYLFGYAVTQFLVFFARANLVVSLGPLDLGLKKAQWTSLIVFLILIPLTLWVRRWRYTRLIPGPSVPVPAGIRQTSELEATHTERNTALEERGRK